MACSVETIQRKEMQVNRVGIWNWKGTIKVAGFCEIVNHNCKAKNYNVKSELCGVAAVRLQYAIQTLEH